MRFFFASLSFVFDAGVDETSPAQVCGNMSWYSPQILHFFQCVRNRFHAGKSLSCQTPWDWDSSFHSVFVRTRNVISATPRALMQPHVSTLPPPCFTDGTTQSPWWSRPGPRQTSLFWLHLTKEWAASLHQASFRVLWQSLIVQFCNSFPPGRRPWWLTSCGVLRTRLSSRRNTDFHRSSSCQVRSARPSVFSMQKIAKCARRHSSRAAFCYWQGGSFYTACSRTLLHRHEVSQSGLWIVWAVL